MKYTVTPIIIILLITGGWTTSVCSSSIFKNSQGNEKATSLDEVLDQSQTNLTLFSSFGYTYVYGDIYGIIEAQSFIPQLGTLTHVDLLLCKSPDHPGSKPVVISIRSSLTGSSLVTASRPANNIPTWGNAQWISFDFPDLKVTIGATYYIVASVEYNASSGLFCWGIGEPDPYPNGSDWYHLNHEANWDTYPDEDLCFKTYGEAVPLSFDSIIGGFGPLTIGLRNIGDDAVHNISWTINVTGGLLGRINSASFGTVQTLPLQTSTALSSKFLFGLGPITIVATARIIDVGKIRQTYSGFLFLFFVTLKDTK
jgi:hypothetical protein